MGALALSDLELDCPSCSLALFPALSLSRRSMGALVALFSARCSSR